jgi:hypothetical protein
VIPQNLVVGSQVCKYPQAELRGAQLGEGPFYLTRNFL